MRGKFNNFSSMRRQEELEARAKPTPPLCVLHRKGAHFCETCQRVKPANKTKATKGWKCTDCRRT